MCQCFVSAAAFLAIFFFFITVAAARLTVMSLFSTHQLISSLCFFFLSVFISRLVNVFNQIFVFAVKTTSLCSHRAPSPCFKRPPWTMDKRVAMRLCDGNMRIVCPLVVSSSPYFSLSLGLVVDFICRVMSFLGPSLSSAPHYVTVAVTELLNESPSPHL